MGQEDSIVFYPAIPKIQKDQKIIEGEKEKRYARLHLYLGLLSGLTLLRPERRFMTEFVSYLNFLVSGSKIGDLFVEKIKRLSPELYEEIKKIINEEDYLLLTEIPFVPTNTQIEATKRFIQLNSEGIGNENRMNLLQRIISGELTELDLPSGKRIGIENLFNDNKLLNDLNNEDIKFIEELKEAIGYYYFDFRYISNNDLKAKRAISLATARIDGLFLIGLGHNYNKLEVANLFHRFVLSPTNFNREERKLLGRLIKDIVDGRVRFIFVETKSKLFQGEERDYKEYLRDISHSVLAMFEFLTTATRICGFRNDPRLSFLFPIMNSSYKKRLEALFRSRNFLKIMRNNFFCLALINWPILQVSEEGKIGLDCEVVNTQTPTLELQRISLRNLLREVRGRAIKMFEEVGQ